MLLFFFLSNHNLLCTNLQHVLGAKQCDENGLLDLEDAAVLPNMGQTVNQVIKLPARETDKPIVEPLISNAQKKKQTDKVIPPMKRNLPRRKVTILKDPTVFDDEHQPPVSKLKYTECIINEHNYVKAPNVTQKGFHREHFAVTVANQSGERKITMINSISNDQNITDNLNNNIQPNASGHKKTALSNSKSKQKSRANQSTSTNTLPDENEDERKKKALAAVTIPNVSHSNEARTVQPIETNPPLEPLPQKPQLVTSIKTVAPNRTVPRFVKRHKQAQINKSPDVPPLIKRINGYKYPSYMKKPSLKRHGLSIVFPDLCLKYTSGNCYLNESRCKRKHLLPKSEELWAKLRYISKADVCRIIDIYFIRNPVLLRNYFHVFCQYFGKYKCQDMLLTLVDICTNVRYKMAKYLKFILEGLLACGLMYRNAIERIIRCVKEQNIEVEHYILDSILDPRNESIIIFGKMLNTLANKVTIRFNENHLNCLIDEFFKNRNDSIQGIVWTVIGRKDEFGLDMSKITELHRFTVHGMEI